MPEDFTGLGIPAEAPRPSRSIIEHHRLGGRQAIILYVYSVLILVLFPLICSSIALSLNGYPATDLSVEALSARFHPHLQPCQLLGCELGNTCFTYYLFQVMILSVDVSLSFALSSSLYKNNDFEQLLSLFARINPHAIMP
jgi:predicted acyltransferase